jgi:hypothetical protein
MRMFIVLALSLMPSLAFAAGATAIPSTCGAPAAMSDGWPVAAPAKEGLDPGLICSIGPALTGLTAVNADGAVVALHPNSVVVVRRDTLAYEHYFRGYDTHTHAASYRFDLEKRCCPVGRYRLGPGLAQARRRACLLVFSKRFRPSVAR